MHLELENFNELYSQLTSPPIIVNDILDTIESEKNAFDENFFVQYHDTDLLDTMPKCTCGHTSGQHHVDRNGKGTICRICKTPVQAMLDKPLEPIIWVVRPKGVDSLINPQAWRLLTDFFSLSSNSNKKFNVIKYLTNTDYRPKRDVHGRWMDLIADMGIKRGLNNFYWNFDEIIGKLSEIPQFSSTRDKKEKLKDIRIFIAMSRDRIFCNAIPIHNKTILVIENTKFGTYMDTTLKTIIDAVRNISGIDSPIKDFSVEQKENCCSKLVESVQEFGKDYEKTFLAGKPGLLRKHVYATRCFYSGRAVITSITEPHHHDGIKLPWAFSVTIFRMHLMGKLMRRGFGYNDASYFLNQHTYIWHPLLRELFDELIEESPYELSPIVERSIVEVWDQDSESSIDVHSIQNVPSRHGIPLIIGRNPSMYRTSIQRMFATHVKDDPRDMSIGYPICSVVGPNA